MTEIVRKKRVGLLLFILTVIICITLIGVFSTEGEKRSGFLTAWTILLLVLASTFFIFWIHSVSKLAGKSRFAASLERLENEPVAIEYWDTLIRALKASRRNRSFFEKRLLPRMQATQEGIQFAETNLSKGKTLLPYRTKIIEIEKILDRIEEAAREEK